ncbi:MAG: hypothetical protein HDR00_05680 [Lachnospiraceae bacterium]|nr:hypothetical protein [Lachnospiraceae bacterium]
MLWAKLGIGFFVIIIIVSLKYRLGLKMYKAAFFFLTISLAILAYKAEPKWDLFVHFTYMNRMEQSNMNFAQILHYGVSNNSNYRLYILFNLICYITTKISNYHLVPFILVLMDYSIIGYISVDWYSNHNSNNKNWLPAVVLSTMFMPYMHAFSGMRNANAACLAGLAVYLYLEKHCQFIYAVFLVALAFFMHPVAIVVLPFMWLANRKLDLKVLGTIFIGLLFISQIANAFAKSDKSYLQMLGRLYLMYSSENQFRSMRRYLFADIIFCILFLIIIFFERSDKTINPIKNFVILLIVFVFGNIGNYDLVIRPMYFFSPLSLPITDMILNTNLKFTKLQSRYLSFGTRILLLGIGIFVFMESLEIIQQFF